MAKRSAEETAAVFLPERLSVPALRVAAAGCTACHLHELGTQTVFGEGTRNARLMLVGEQPGDKEDLTGKPFVGPAGQLLDRSLVAAGIDRKDVYVTNAVKHFKWVAKGKRRIHQKPNADEIMACKPWLEAELDAVEPEVVVALGATAAQTLLGRGFKVTQHRGEWVEWDRDPMVTATVHPSSILRGDAATRREQEALLVKDLEVVARRLSA